MIRKLFQPRGDKSEDVRLSSALRCLVAVARQHGIQLSMQQVVHDNVLKEEAVDRAQLAACARKAGLRAEFIKGDWETLKSLGKALPVIVNLQDGSSMVLMRLETQSGPERLQMRDPISDGELLLDIDRVRFEKAWSGEIILIKRDYDVADEAQPMGMRLVLATILRDRKIVKDIAFSALALSVLALAPIIFFRLMVNHVLLTGKSMSTFTTLCTFMIILIVFEAIFGTLRSHLVLILSTRVDVKLSTLVFEKVLNLPMDFFEQKQVGSIAHQINEMTKVRYFLVGQALGTLLDSLVLIVFLPVMFYYSPILTLFVLAICVLIVLWTAFMLPEFRRRSRAVAAAEAKRGSFMVQNLHGIRTVKSLSLTARQLQQYDVHVARVANMRRAQDGVVNLTQAVVTPLERLMVSGGLALGVYFAITGDDPVMIGALVMFFLLCQRVATPIMKLAQLVHSYDEARTAMEAVSEIVNQPAEDTISEHGARSTIEGAITFSNVRFQYKGTFSPALTDVSFEVPAGATFGVMGRSGSGKTTVTRLLQRLHTDYSGQIKVDGIDVREYDLNHLRRSMGVVLQDNFLFTGTIRENIASAKSDATFEEVTLAARLAGAEEFIDKLPRGYETVIYEGSANLSGGQRQRIAIARALITNPKLLILDEATSALDAESEAIVNANLSRISRGRTVIIISHRLSALVSADAILVLDQGRVRDIGRHGELLERCDIYSDLWHQQNAHLKTIPSKPAALIGHHHVS